MAVAYLLAFSLLALTTAHGMPVGIAYGIWSACGVALTATLARIMVKDPLTWLMGLGIIIIVGGVLLIELSATSH